MERLVEKLPPKIDLKYKIKRVCAYARVSTGKDSMLHSLSAQVSYYQDYIQSHPGWKFCGVYADEAISGTKEQRAEFQKMLAECRKGNIDLVITKSISRFARNTVTLLRSVRELKQMGVEVFFEEQNIYSLSTDGEFMLTILASFAQEESRSVSENMKWRVQKNFEEGKPWGMNTYGYKCVKGQLQIKPAEAEVVRRIYREYLEGKGRHTIAKELNREGIKAHKSDKWYSSAVHWILTNYAYTGNLILQQTYQIDYISKKCVKNRGELPKYHAQDTHEAIIPMELFERVQKEVQRRAQHYYSDKPKSPDCIFTRMIRCPYCGAYYHRKKGLRVFQWRCHTYLIKGKEFCSQSKTIPEDTLLAVTAEVLGMDDLSSKVLAESLEYIEAKEGNTLVFHFLDGRVVERVWQDRSRRESWTPEMREEARKANLRKGKK